MLLILLGFPCIIIFYVLEICKSDGVTMTVVISLFAWVSAAHKPRSDPELQGMFHKTLISL